MAVLHAAKTPLVVNKESIEKALEGSTRTSPQGKVSLPTVERYVRRLEDGEVPPAIKIDVDRVTLNGAS